MLLRLTRLVVTEEEWEQLFEEVGFAVSGGIGTSDRLILQTH